MPLFSPLACRCPFGFRHIVSVHTARLRLLNGIAARRRFVRLASLRRPLRCACSSTVLLPLVANPFSVAALHSAYSNSFVRPDASVVISSGSSPFRFPPRAGRCARCRSPCQRTKQVRRAAKPAVPVSVASLPSLRCAAVRHTARLRLALNSIVASDETVSCASLRSSPLVGRMTARIVSFMVRVHALRYASSRYRCATPLVSLLRSRRSSALLSLPHGIAPCGRKPVQSLRLAPYGRVAVAPCGSSPRAASLLCDRTAGCFTRPTRIPRTDQMTATDGYRSFKPPPASVSLSDTATVKCRSSFGHRPCRRLSLHGCRSSRGGRPAPSLYAGG